MKTEYSKRFLKEAKDLRKKYHNFDDDLRSFVNDLKSGKHVGADLIENIKRLPVYKVRIKNSSSATGKRGGFRVIYYVEIDEQTFYLLSIYSKSQTANISQNEILEILKSEKLIK